MTTLPKKQVLGVNITNASDTDVLEYMDVLLKQKEENFYIVTPNPEIIVYANKHLKFKSILNNAQVALCDGAGLLWAGQVLKKPIKSRIAGTDFVKMVCERYADQHVSLGFLGAKNGIAEQAVERLRSLYPKLNVVYLGSEWGEAGFGSTNKNQESRIKNQGTKMPQIDILFVAFGAPKQEEWMYNNLDHGVAHIMIGVGGAFDYISGKVARAPFFIRSLGLEWLFRLIRQPWRIKRQLALPVFVWMVLKEKFS